MASLVLPDPRAERELQVRPVLVPQVKLDPQVQPVQPTEQPVEPAIRVLGLQDPQDRRVALVLPVLVYKVPLAARPDPRDRLDLLALPRARQA